MYNMNLVITCRLIQCIDFLMKNARVQLWSQELEFLIKHIIQKCNEIIMSTCVLQMLKDFHVRNFEFYTLNFGWVLQLFLKRSIKLLEEVLQWLFVVLLFKRYIYFRSILCLSYTSLDHNLVFCCIVTI